MNIVGEGFNETIIEQIKQRQKIYGSGYIERRNLDEISYLNSNTSWCKLVSSVDVVSTSNLINTSLNKLKIDRKNSLAKQFVLFNGTNESPSNQRHGLSLNNSILGENAVYGIGGNEYGLVPMMGIQSVEVKHENRGSIRRAIVKIKAFNKIQFDIIDILYLRLGFNVLLEWGHSMYYDNTGTLNRGSDINNSLADYFLEGKKPGPFVYLTYDKFLDLIQEQRIKSNGNYDAMFAKVSNFQWSFLPDGSYDITLNLVSIGDVVESFKVNALINGINNPSNLVNNEDTNLTPIEIIDLYANKNTIGQYFYKLKSEITSTSEYIALQNRKQDEVINIGKKASYNYK